MSKYRKKPVVIEATQWFNRALVDKRTYPRQSAECGERVAEPAVSEQRQYRQFDICACGDFRCDHEANDGPCKLRGGPHAGMVCKSFRFSRHAPQEEIERQFELDRQLEAAAPVHAVEAATSAAAPTSAQEPRDLTDTELSDLKELPRLRREFELSALGDRPQSMSAAKLKRLIILERLESVLLATGSSYEPVLTPEEEDLIVGAIPLQALPAPSAQAGPELLACPFCGKQPDLIPVEDADDPFRARCGTIGCPVDIRMIRPEVWNRRVPPPVGVEEALVELRAMFPNEHIMIQIHDFSGIPGCEENGYVSIETETVHRAEASLTEAMAAVRAAGKEQP